MIVHGITLHGMAWWLLLDRGRVGVPCVAVAAVSAAATAPLEEIYARVPSTRRACKPPPQSLVAAATVGYMLPTLYISVSR